VDFRTLTLRRAAEFGSAAEIVSWWCVLLVRLLF
jgi:hypothetical protein